MIVAEAVTYEYPNVRALSGVSFSVGQGAIAALIGPNGAGKTTLLRCLAALDRPYSGTIAIDGIDTADHPREVHRRIGYLSDYFGLYGDLSVERCLRHAALSGGVPPAEVKAAVARAAERVGLDDRMRDAAGTLSRGLRQRLGIAQAMIHDPTVLLLDEPASGLDPEARHALSELFKALRDQGMTLLVSSHILSELEDYATEVLFIRDGRLLQHAPLGASTATTVRLRVELAHPVADLASRLSGIAGMAVESADESGAVVVASAEPEARRVLLAALLASELPVCGFAELRERLQESYLTFVDGLEGKP
ncbi:MAG: ATP-binding cassette domain-containing protein [Alphaproteobacteria bacterium]|nr:ATP-binding cassette domain-containing protein [Alphaproteobacteria bacterium]